MGFKDLLFKQDRPKNVEDVSSILNDLPSAEPSQNDTLPVDVADVQSIDDLYNSLGMISNKIYDVIPFIDSLPSTMNMIDKKTSLIKILQAAKYDIDELKKNAEDCIGIIENANVVSANSLEENKTTYQNEIESKYAEITELKGLIETEEKKHAQQVSLFNQEMDRLKNIKNYLE